MTDPLDKPILLTEESWRRAMFPDKERLEKSRQWWSNYLHREISSQEAAEIHQNVFGLFKLLFEIDAREQAKKAGLAVVDKEKVDKLRVEIVRLQDQVAGLNKMLGRWSKDDPQSAALEQARAALEEAIAVKRREIGAELNVAAPPVPAASSDPPRSAPPAPVRPARSRSRRSSSP